jgi:hypothetical protein
LTKGRTRLKLASRTGACLAWRVRRNGPAEVLIVEQPKCGMGGHKWLLISSGKKLG